MPIVWGPERKIVRRATCPLCGRSVQVRNARRCMGCAKVVCLECFDISMGVCVTCRSRFSRDDSCPDYIC